MSLRGCGRDCKDYTLHCDEAKIQHVFYESPGTDHEWQTWRRDLKDFAPRLFLTKSPNN